MFEGRDPADGIELAERVSGDTSVGHALAYCQAVEAAANVDVPLRALSLRVILLELERLYNHVADVGAIANDTGFAIAHAHCYRIREQILRLNKQLTGSRLLRGVLVREVWYAICRSRRTSRRVSRQPSSISMKSWRSA